jgi:hypothetical protein
VKNRFQSLPFKCNLQRYNAARAGKRNGKSGPTLQTPTAAATATAVKNGQGVDPAKVGLYKC